ncbi:bifunctional protein-disulfide isomerase/oxidoreductase DsbC [Alteromonas sediminis]|uniref:bifunctional protein-disulfide isomerase/oxidoreductase DsbC n=1 Tax=Alteromonas sediminis TaxID=2259342 RepID=UPI001404C78E|nr:bifunctional protein-disulfide isomerase/oxidoreductase DsbC [Alteromonas sediminis]
MNGFRKTILLAVACFTTFGCMADEHSELIKKLEQSMGWEVTAIADAPVDGLYQLNTARGIFYASKDGKYLMQARIYNMDAGMRDETEAALSSIRLEGLKQFDGDYIEFKAKDEKFIVTVFTDISCGYCRRLHEQMGEYNERGITVRYLAFPRAGTQGKTFNDMISIWCSSDQQEAMTQGKAGENVELARCENSIVEQYQFGQKIGVNGTPNIILPNGRLIPGYQPAPALLQALQSAG